MPKVDIGDAEIHYEEAGSGPPLLLVPGLGGHGSFWARQVEAFKGDFRVIIHDHRGAGQSTHSPIRYSVDQMAADVLKLMDALDIDRAHFVGHSTGGAIGQTIAQDRPERLATLGLSATWAGSDPFFRRSFELRKALLETFGLERYSEMTALVLNPPFWVAENDAAISAGAKAALDNAAPVEVMISRIDGIMAFDRRARMDEIAMPTQIIVARDDMVTPIHMTEELSAGIPHAETVVLERGGHFVPIVLPEDYNPPVLEFLRKHRDL